MQVTRAPAAHVEPLHGPGGSGPVLAVQQNQLLQGPHGRVLQHLFQLWGKDRSEGGRQTRGGGSLRPLGFGFDS